MKTTFTLPSPDYFLEFGDVDKLRVGDEVRVLTPNNPRWCANPMRCMVKAKNADGTVDLERLK